MTSAGSSLRVSVVMPATVKARSGQIAAFCRHVEEVGLDGIFVGDHLAPAGPQPDSTLVLAVAAAATSRVAIGFGVMVVALRGPAWAAKQVATLQALSGERVVLGVGVGGEMHGATAWDAVGVPYAERGASTDAALRVLPGLIAGAKTTLDSGAELQLAPGAPVPPLWIGGNGRTALRRAATFGDAWFPSMLLATQLPNAHGRLRELAEEQGRPVPRIALGTAALLGPAGRNAHDAFVQALVGGYGIAAHRAELVPITGDAPEVANRMAEYADAGVDHLIVGLVDDDWQSTCEALALARTCLTA